MLWVYFEFGLKKGHVALDISRDKYTHTNTQTQTHAYALFGRGSRGRCSARAVGLRAMGSHCHMKEGSSMKNV